VIIYVLVHPVNVTKRAFERPESAEAHRPIRQKFAKWTTTD